MGFLSSPIMLGPSSDVTPLSPLSSALFVGISPPLLFDTNFPTATLLLTIAIDYSIPSSLYIARKSFDHWRTSNLPSQKPETESDWTLDQSETHNLRTPPAEPTSDKPCGCEASHGPQNRQGANRKVVIPTPRHAMVVLCSLLNCTVLGFEH